MARKSDLLDKYNAKRDFKQTAEPAGKVAKGNTQRYLIQKHAATRLHYDFRIELDGVLKSWAVTRGPSLDPNDKRLAVEVEDHPLDYGDFEGTIPAGQYGGGTVMLWDTGTWEPIDDPHKGLAAGNLKFRLHGERLKGEWVLVRIRGRKGEKRTNWLLIKHADAESIEGDGEKLLERFNTSIKTKRTMDAITADKAAVWQSKPAAKKASVKAKTVSKKTAFPGFIAPQLATLVTAMPAGDKWVHEVKFDGYRIQAHIKQGKVKLFTRSGLNWTNKFPTLAASLAHLPCENGVLDGEVVAVNSEGVSSFKALQNALTDEDDSELQYYAFDLLHRDGTDLTREKLTARKASLAELLEKPPERIFYSDHFASEGSEFLTHACKLNLEGVISKLADGVYQKGRSKSWVKSKCSKRQEFVIAGYTLPSKGKGIGALIIGFYEGGELHYAGRVGTGFTTALSLSLREKLEKLRSKTSSFAVPLSGLNKKGVIYVKPQLVCEVQYAEWTDTGVLRHPSFQGLREDKPAAQVGRDKAAPVHVASKKTGDSFHSVKISSPDKIMYPDDGITKGMLAEYYAGIADYILPHIAERPLSVIRCTSGIIKACFFQRHNTLKGVNIFDVKLPEKPKEPPYLMIKDAKGLMSLVQMGVVEMHSWNSHAKKVTLPDQIIFDLDPDSAVGWDEVVEAAFEVKARMEAMGLKSFVKTTGGKGLHVVIPLTPKLEWDVIKPFTKSIAIAMEKDNPKKYISTMSKAKRKGKIFIDYLRNDETSTAIAPFAARARAGATVSTPITWEELKKGVNPHDFTILSVPARLKKLKRDPWEGFFATKQAIAKKFL